MYSILVHVSQCILSVFFMCIIGSNLFHSITNTEPSAGKKRRPFLPRSQPPRIPPPPPPGQGGALATLAMASLAPPMLETYNNKTLSGPPSGPPPQPPGRSVSPKPPLSPKPVLKRGQKKSDAAPHAPWGIKTLFCFILVQQKRKICAFIKYCTHILLCQSKTWSNLFLC